MSTPVTERPRTGTRTPTIPAQRVPAQRSRPRRPQRTGQAVPATRTGTTRISGAAERAYQRRDDRLRRISGLWAGARLARAASAPGRTPFVLLVMALLAVGLVAILWLSTAAAADSYRLTDARAEARTLQERSETLRREVATLESAPEIARRAEALGLIAVRDPARLVVGPDGAVTVVGDPRAATRPAPPTPPPTATAPTPAATPGPQGQQQGGQASQPSAPTSGATSATSEAATQQEESAGQGQQPTSTGTGRG